MEMVSATATRRDVLAMIPTGLAAAAASDMTLRIPVAARDPLALLLFHHVGPDVVPTMLFDDTARHLWCSLKRSEPRADQRDTCAHETARSRCRLDQRAARGERRLSSAAICRPGPRGQTAVGDAGDRPPLPRLCHRQEDSRDGLGRGDRRRCGACGVVRGPRPCLASAGHAGHRVPHRFDDQERNRARRAEAARRWPAGARRPRVAMDPGIRTNGTAHARHGALDHSPVAESQRRFSRGQSVGRSTVERHRRHAGRLARQRHSVLHTAWHALRIFQLRVRSVGPG